MLRVFGVILILIAALIAWAAIDSRNIDVTRFTVSGAPEAFSGFKIVQISDLHNAEFGTDNQKLIDILKSEAPGCDRDHRRFDRRAADEHGDCRKLRAPLYGDCGLLLCAR